MLQRLCQTAPHRACGAYAVHQATHSGDIQRSTWQSSSKALAQTPSSVAKSTSAGVPQVRHTVSGHTQKLNSGSKCPRCSETANICHHNISPNHFHVIKISQSNRERVSQHYLTKFSRCHLLMQRESKQFNTLSRLIGLHMSPPRRVEQSSSKISSDKQILNATTYCRASIHACLHTACIPTQDI